MSDKENIILDMERDGKFNMEESRKRRCVVDLALGNSKELPTPLESMPPAYQKQLKAQQCMKKGLLPLPECEKIVPKTPKGTAPMNNDIARTSIFSPVRRGRRNYCKDKKLDSPAGTIVTYTGLSLDMGDSDVYLKALEIAAGYGPNERITIVVNQFVKSIGRQKGSSTTNWLKESFFRLATGHVKIENSRYAASFPLLGALLLDKETNELYFSIPVETMNCFHSYGYVNWEKRLKLEKQVNLAKWIQDFAVTHAKGEHISRVAALYKKSGYKIKIQDFKNILAIALDELVQVGEFQSWSWASGKESVRWVR